MLHFVFVHGFGGGGWAFYQIRCLLEKLGHKVSCPDLKSGGIDPTDPKTLKTFEDYNQPLIDLLYSLPRNEKVILVAHSAGGLSLTHAIHKFPERIHLAIFVAATMLRLGFWTEQDFRDGIPPMYGNENGTAHHRRHSTNKGCHITLGTPQGRSKIHRGMHEIVTLSSMLKREGPLAAIQAARFNDGDRRVDEVPRVYIKTSWDTVLLPEQQDAMIHKWPPVQVHVLQSDHNPFFTTPLDVFGLIIRVTASISL